MTSSPRSRPARLAGGAAATIGVAAVVALPGPTAAAPPAPPAGIPVETFSRRNDPPEAQDAPGLDVALLGFSRTGRVAFTWSMGATARTVIQDLVKDRIIADLPEGDASVAALLAGEGIRSAILREACE